jgi:signal transduction histidine kinase
VLTALKMRFAAGGDATAALDETERAQLMHWVDEALAVARRISAELRPPLLDDLGLAAALEHHVEMHRLPQAPSFVVEVHDEAVLTPMQKNQLFRIAQEAITNVLRHAEAREVRIEGRAEAAGYRFGISDDGRGPVGPMRDDASGVSNMRERAKLIGAQFDFGPNLLRGTRVLVRLPRARLAAAAAADPGLDPDAVAAGDAGGSTR